MSARNQFGKTNPSSFGSMVGALNKLPVAASGMIFFGDAVTFSNVSAILLGLVAGLVYAAGMFDSLSACSELRA